MNEAIKLAIEKGGYNGLNFGKDWYGHKTDTFNQMLYKNPTVFALDPVFWKSLGKALKWQEEKFKLGDFVTIRIGNGFVTGKVTSIEKNEAKVHLTHGGYMNIPVLEWLYNANQYFELLLTGGNTDKFWKELIK